MREDLKLRRVAWLLAAWGFTSLVATGQLLLPALIGIYAVYLIFLVWPRFLGRVRTGTWVFIDLLAFAVAAVYSKVDLGTSLVYGTSYLQFRMLIRLNRPFDFLLLFLLSFFQVVLAAAISADLGFGFLLAGFLGLAVLATILVTLERGRVEATTAATRLRGIGRPVAGRPPTRVLPAIAPPGSVSAAFLTGGALFRTALVCLAILPVTAFFFTVVPRLAVRKVLLRLRPFEEEAVTGFSDSVQLGALSALRKDKTPVLRAWILKRRGERGTPPPYLRLRGVALDQFEGKTWSYSGARVKDPDQSVYLRERPYFQFTVPYAKDQYATTVLRLRMRQEARATNGWVFAPPYLSSLGFDRARQVKCLEKLHSFQLHRRPKGEMDYRTVAYLEPSRHLIQSRLNAIAAGGPSGGAENWRLPPEERRDYTHVPLFVRPSEKTEIENLARQVTQSANTPYERVSALTRFFHEDFTYSLEPQVHRVDFLTHFLLRSRKGHCETFASAMAVLCRMVDVPARVVNGFYTTEFNRVERCFLVRQSNAHTWVEVFIDGHGWMTADPTPPSALPSTPFRFAFLSWLSDYWDSWTMSWRRYVVDYNLSDQLQILQRFLAEVASLGLFKDSGDGAGVWAKFTGWLESARQHPTARLHPIYAASLVGLAAVWAVYRRQKRRNGRLHARAGPHHWRICAVDFYARILAALTRQGWQRRPGQTPAEFARAVVAARPDLADLVILTQAYYRVRFSPAELRPEESERAVALLASLVRSRKHRLS